LMDVLKAVGFKEEKEDDSYVKLDEESSS